MISIIGEGPIRNEIEKIISAPITESQRQCLSHTLRNCEQAIEGVLAVIESNSTNFSPADVGESLKIVQKKISEIIEAASRNSFCSYSQQECEFICKFTDCKNVRKISSEEGLAAKT